MPTTLIAAVLHPYQDQVLALADAVELPTARLGLEMPVLVACPL